MPARPKAWAHHRREHEIAKTGDECDIDHHRQRRPPRSHARPVLLGDDRIPERRDHAAPTASSDVIRMKASSRPPSTGPNADTVIPSAVKACRMPAAVESSPSYVASIVPPAA